MAGKSRAEALDVIRTAWEAEGAGLALARDQLLGPGIAAWLVGNLTLQGELSPDDRLPTNLDIGDALGMSGRSVSTGLRILEECGVLHARDNKVGTTVVAPATPDDLIAITQKFKKRDPAAKSYPDFPSQADRDATHRLAVEAEAANPWAPGRETVLAMIGEVADNPDYPEGAAALAIPKPGRPLLHLSALLLEGNCRREASFLPRRT